jgi:hypothetical protein
MVKFDSRKAFPKLTSFIGGGKNEIPVGIDFGDFIFRSIGIRCRPIGTRYHEGAEKKARGYSGIREHKNGAR